MAPPRAAEKGTSRRKPPNAGEALGLGVAAGGWTTATSWTRCDQAVAMRTLQPRVVVFPMTSSSQACRATHRPLGPSLSG